MALPLDTPLIMQSASMNGCNDLYPTKSPVFLRDDDFKAKVVVLHSVAEGVIVIRSASDGDELIVGANGGCYFESSVLGIGEQFKVEAIANGSVVFVSCRTGHVLDTDDTGLPRCVDTIRRGWFLLQHDLAHKVSQNPVVEAAPVMGPDCGHCRDHEAKERRGYIMKLVSLGKSLEEVDAILLRMYAWPTAEKVIVAGGGGRGAVATEKQAPPPNGNSAAWQWMKPE